MSKLNKKMWELYLKNRIDTKREYASPMEASSFENLANAYIEVELNQTLGTVHGYEVAEKSEIVAKGIERRIKDLKNAFRLV